VQGETERRIKAVRGARGGGCGDAPVSLCQVATWPTSWPWPLAGTGRRARFGVFSIYLLCGLGFCCYADACLFSPPISNDQRCSHTDTVTWLQRSTPFFYTPLAVEEVVSVLCMPETEKGCFLSVLLSVCVAHCQ
jgi:hypothetical protein